MEIASSLLTGLVSAAIAAVVTYFATRSKIRLDLTVENDKELRKKRLEVYQKLWIQLKPLARFSPEKELSYQLIKDTSEQMRNWYFDEASGIFLSKESRKPYFELKESLQKIIGAERLVKDADVSFTKDELEITVKTKNKTEKVKEILETVLEQGKELRRCLSDDIGSRKEPFLS
ncbi:MAG: hypothetical protein ABJA66_20215 [Actinomycetota bacterium]